MTTLFSENQRFTQWWLWLILAGILFIPTYGLINQNFLGNPVGDNPSTDAGMIAYFLTSLAVVIFFVLMNLITEINEVHIYIKFYPLFTKTLEWKDIHSARIVDYGFAGGWGIRLGTPYGTLYNVKGSKGLAIEMKNGKKYCIGTQKPEEMQAVVDRIKSN